MWLTDGQTLLEDASRVKNGMFWRGQVTWWSWQRALTCIILFICQLLHHESKHSLMMFRQRFFSGILPFGVSYDCFLKLEEMLSPIELFSDWTKMMSWSYFVWKCKKGGSPETENVCNFFCRMPPAFIRDYFSQLLKMYLLLSIFSISLDFGLIRKWSQIVDGKR